MSERVTKDYANEKVLHKSHPPKDVTAEYLLSA
jgi:hypothetical protein